MHETYSPQLFNCSAVLVKQEAIQNIVPGLNEEGGKKCHVGTNHHLVITLDNCNPARRIVKTHRIGTRKNAPETTS